MDFPDNGQRVLVWDDFKNSWTAATFHDESKRFRVGSIKALLQFEWWHPGPEAGPCDKVISK